MEAMMVHCLSVVTIHYIWRGYQRWLNKRQKRLGQRVAYMLWVAAQQAQAREHSLAS
jgi:hypothetical protein